MGGLKKRGFPCGEYSEHRAIREGLWLGGGGGAEGGMEGVILVEERGLESGIIRRQRGGGRGSEPQISRNPSICSPPPCNRPL